MRESGNTIAHNPSLKQSEKIIILLLSNVFQSNVFSYGTSHERLNAVLCRQQQAAPFVDSDKHAVDSRTIYIKRDCLIQPQQP